VLALSESFPISQNVAITPLPYKHARITHRYYELNVDKSSGSTTSFAKTLTVACLKHKTIN